MKTDIKTHLRRAARVSGMMPAKPRPGCPALPQVASRALPGGECEWTNRAEYLNAARQAHADGYGLALLIAFRTLAMFSPDKPMPSWIVAGISNAVGLWLDGAVDTLQEGLGASLGNRKMRPATMRAQLFAGQMFLDAQRAIENGAAVDEELWANIGERYQVSASTARRAVTAIGKLTNKPKKLRQKRSVL